MFFTETIFVTKCKSVQCNNHCQVFASNKRFIAVLPMKFQDEFKTSLKLFCKEVDVRVDLILDRFSAQTK